MREHSELCKNREKIKMLVIRLARFGAKKKPTYRVVVIEKERARNSRSVEVVGHYNPIAKPAQVQLNRDRIDFWVKNGVQPSDTVSRLLKTSAPETPAAV
jgi:small subunit ribosomal protein S16